MKRLSILLVIIAFHDGNKGLAQQQGQLSQYMLNYYLINPAASGAEDYADFKGGYRAQWLGLQNAPSNYYLTFHTPVGKVHSNHKGKRSNKENTGHQSIGGFVRGLQTGVLNQTGVYFSYGYHLPLNKNHMLSLGASLGVLQYRIAAGDHIDPDDPAMTQGAAYMPDANLGIWFYGKDYFMGLSSAQVLGDILMLNKSGINERYGKGTTVNRHYYVTGGYAFKLSEHIKAIPSILLKYSTSNYQIDLNSKIRFYDKVWVGISYRDKDAVVIMAGCLLKNAISIGYSYDATISKLNQYSSGSHEIVLGYRINKKEGVLSPSDFW